MAGQPVLGSERSAGPPLLRSVCLRLLATALALPADSSSGGSSYSGCSFSWAAQRVFALPAELRQDLLCLLASWRLLTAAACAALQPSCFLSGMASLDLSGCSLLSASALSTHLFACQLPQLLSLSLRGVLHLTDSLLESILGQCPSLRQLDVSQCAQLGSAAVAAVGGTASGVGEVSMGSDAGDRRSGAHSRLESLSLAGCWQIASVGALQACGSLTSLVLDGCWQLRSADVRQVLASLTLLESLSLSGCPQLDSSILVTQQQLSLYPPHNRGPGYIGPVQAEEGVDDPLQQRLVEGAGMDPSSKPGLPLAGVPLYRLRSLDVSSTAVRNDLLYWVALRCCARLQRLAVGGCKGVDGVGVAAVLAAKQSLLQHTLPQAAQGAGQNVQLGPEGTALSLQQSSLEVLPLLELSAGGISSWASDNAGASPSSWWEEQQAAYERSQGPLRIHISPDQPPIPFRLPTTASVPAAAAAAAAAPPPPPPPRAAAPAQQAAGRPLAGPMQSSSPAWPPESAAEVLLCLGSQGLGKLEGLDLSQGGTAVAAAVAAITGQHCSGLKRLKLSGCQVADDELREVVVLPCLTQLDVSGCVGSKAAAPGSRFQRHPAKRRQRSGVSDESLSLLGLRYFTGNAQHQRGASLQQHSVAQQGTAQRSSLPAESAAQQGQQLQEPLQALDAGGLLITDASIGSLKGLASLQVRGCKRLTDSGVLQCLLGCPSLTRLDLGGCSQLSVAALGCSTVKCARASEPPEAVGLAGSEQAEHGGGQQAQQGQHAQHAGAGAEGIAQGCSGAPHVAVSSLSTSIPKRVSLPKHAAGAEVLAWLAGNSTAPGLATPPDAAPYGVASGLHVQHGAGGHGKFGQRASRPSSSDQAGVLGGGSSSSSRWQRLERGMGLPLGCSPLQKLELHCGSWPALPPGPPASVNGRNGTSAGSSSNRGSSLSLHMAALAESCPQLRSLQLLSAAGLGPGFVGCLAAHCQLLSRLSITDCGQLSSGDLAELAKLPCLRQLNLSGCSGFGDAGLIAYAQAIWQQPQAVAETAEEAAAAAAAAAAQVAPTSTAGAAAGGPALSSGTALRARSVAGGLGQGNLAQGGSAADVGRGGGPHCFLHTLKLDGCADISDRGVMAVLAAAPHLATLSLRRLRGVGDESAAAALRSSANLRSLLLGDCGVRGSFVAVVSEVVCTGLETLELPRSLLKQAEVAASLECLCKLTVKFA